MFSSHFFEAIILNFISTTQKNLILPILTLSNGCKSAACMRDQQFMGGVIIIAFNNLQLQLLNSITIRKRCPKFHILFIIIKYIYLLSL